MPAFVTDLEPDHDTGLFFCESSETEKVLIPMMFMQF